MADWSQRQGEIAIKSRAENYNFVLVVTSLATIGGLFIVFRNDWEKLKDVLPTALAIGALLLSLLPVNLAHIATSTELRRHYLEVRIEPRIVALLNSYGRPENLQSPLMTFERFDRYENTMIYNWLIFGRALFSLAPATILASLCIWSITQLDANDVAITYSRTDFIVDLCLVALALAATGLSIAALVSMWSRTKRLRLDHSDQTEFSLRFRSPRWLLLDAKGKTGPIQGKKRQPRRGHPLR